MTTETKILTDEQIDKIAMDVHVRCTCIPGATFYNAADKAIQAVLQSPEVQALRKDAERMRHCLEHGFPQQWEQMYRGVLRAYWTQRPGAQEEYRKAVGAIDAAMEAKR